MLNTNIISNVDPSKYVVLDVETNGLSSIKHDLLSISIYKPDTGEIYNRFLPLELNSSVITTHINGIKTEDLQGLLPLTQDDVDKIIQIFDLKKRTILTYGNLDEKFIVKYFQRHDLQGIDYFAFYNFKHDIISSKYSEGNITKDNLCKLYGIDNVRKVHSGSNDCILEWKLFERMNGHKLLITDNKVFEFNNEYIIPASLLASHRNLRYFLPNLPKITCENEVVFSLTVTAEKIIKFPTNINGMMIEHLINSMLKVQKIDSKALLLENKKKLTFVGQLRSNVPIAPMIFKEDGTMLATRPQDKKLEKSINSVVDVLQGVMRPLVDYIENGIFIGQPINSQELVINHEKNILALCDLSTKDAILEIKTTSSKSLRVYAEQLFYESNGRKCFVLFTEWEKYPSEITYKIYKVVFHKEEIVNTADARFKRAKEKIETDNIELLSYIDAKSPIKLRCKKCGKEWNTSYFLAFKNRNCPICFPSNNGHKHKPKKKVLSESERLAIEKQKAVQKFEKYKTKLEERSEHKITAISFKDSRSPAKARCLQCGREWETRADHLLDRPYCSVCKKKNKNSLFYL